MTSTMMVERTGMGVPGMTYPGYPTGSYQTGYTTPFTPTNVNYFSVPRCSFKVEKVSDGFKIQCVCEDQTSCSVVQNLCSVLAGGMVCCNVTFNGMPVCNYNCTMGYCRWEAFDKGVTFYCTSGDSKCCATLQAWCDCFTSWMNAGCQACFCINNTPVCCGCYETCTTKQATPAKR